MALSTSAIRAAVASAARAVSGLLSTVSHLPATGRSASGTPTYGDAVSRQAIVTRRPSVVRSSDGLEVASTIRLTFPFGFTVTTRDRFVVEGTTYTALAVEMTLAADEATPYAVEVWC